MLSATRPKALSPYVLSSGRASERDASLPVRREEDWPEGIIYCNKNAVIPKALKHLIVFAVYSALCAIFNTLF